MDVNRWIYDPRRGLHRDTRNPSVNSENQKRHNMEETKKNNDLGKKQSWDDAEDEIFSTTSKASSSSENRVVKTLFGEESNSISPKNLFVDDLFKKIDRDTIIQRLRECGYQKKPNSSKEYLFKRLLEYANERNLSIHDVLERSPILTPSGSVDGTTKRTYLTPTMNKSTQTVELSEKKEIVSSWNMICYRTVL